MFKTFEVFDAISGLIIQQIISIGWWLRRIPQIECGVFGIEMSEYHRSYNSPSFVKIKHKEFVSNFEKLELKGLNRPEATKLINLSSADFMTRVEDYES